MHIGENCLRLGMTKFLRALAILFLSLAVLSCSPSGKDENTSAASSAPASQKQMLVYGSNECDHCINFKKKMDSLGIKYTFFDVNVDESKANEMLAKLQQARFVGNITLPVVDIEGRVMVNPDLQMVRNFVVK